MNNLKTALLVVLLMGALYGAYQYLNHRDVPPPAEAQLQFDQGIEPPTIEFGAPGADFAPVPVSLPAAAPSEVESPAPPSDMPSFAVMPPPSSPKFDTPPTPETSPPPLLDVNESPAERPGAVALPSETSAAQSEVRPAEHSAYAEGVARVASRDASTIPPPTENIPNLQANPWYRPEAKASATATGMSPEATRQANRAAFQQAWSEARSLVESGKFAQALAALTPFYEHADLTAVEQQQLQKTLDSLAGRVIYSTEHYLAEAHVVRADETLMDIAAKYNVQWQLLQNINGVRDPYVLVPKTQLKVVPGPFRAEVSLHTSHLTLFVDKYYAGRFPISIGSDPMPPPGQYAVRDKREGKEYFPANGRTIPALHPSNPYGQHWIDLGSEVCIHGSAEREVSPDYGCISLSPRDAADVWGILTLGSNVTVTR